MAEHKSYRKQVHLKYSDGLEIVQVLDAPTIRRLENGDEELLQQIRRNLEDCGQATQIQPACIEEENVEFEDDQASNSDLEDNQPVSWSRDATELLISLYEDYEQELEDPRKKKKDTRKKITAALNEAGYKYVQNKVEGKWRGLLALHKDLSLNKKKTGQKRKTFQYFEKIDNILSKRHNINPPFTSGSSLQNQKEAKFSTKQLDKNMIGCTSIGCTMQTDENSSTMSTSDSGKKCKWKYRNFE
uniref:Myb/SANT-like DNA-binding domain-containing protein n=1 Tax=Magallana gigas TaxID=29159 RepID=A0A8W8MTI2_MAGGI